MRWPPTEYLLKGIYLGLLFYAAWSLGTKPPDNPTEALLQFNLPPLIGLVGVLLAAGALKLREGYRIKGRFFIFLLFLLLETPTGVYAGILGGTVVGVFLIRSAVDPRLLLPLVGGGALLGVCFVLPGLIRRRLVRQAVILLAAAVLASAAVLAWRFSLDADESTKLIDPVLFGIQLLLGLPYFYVLTFAGREEETEVEIGALCAALSVGCTLIFYNRYDQLARLLGLLVPVGLFLVYTTRVLPALRVLKHVLRGMSHLRIGRHRRALQAFRRALQLDPANSLAREGFWEVHRSLDLDQLHGDPETLALVDFDLCLERAGSLLLQGKPNEEQMAEAQSLLALVVSQRPELRPAAVYWQAVAQTHLRQYDQAADHLRSLLDPEPFGRHNPQRQKILLAAWQLGLLLHAELKRRVGSPQLALPGRRMEAIAAVERHLAEDPADQSVWGLKRVLYHELTEDEYVAEVQTWADEQPGAAPPPRFDHGYVQQLGLALINDETRWPRGAAYLRMAAHGLPALAPGLFVEIAQALGRAGRAEEALHNYDLAKQAGRRVGPKNLPESEAATYFATVKYLAETAQARGDLTAAVENWRLYLDAPTSGIETLRTLAELCERQGDVFAALRFTDMALVYNPKDPDLLRRKDAYYFSVMPDQLQTRLESVRDGFDWDYCVKKTQAILDNPQLTDVEWLEVADHLIQLAQIGKPDSRPVKLLLARVRLRYGERDEALHILEGVREPKPETFPSSEDEDAWYVASQLLGDLYMEIGRPDLALPCFTDFRQSHRSGAKTWFKMGQAHEQLGDTPRAVKCYKMVTAYDGNPLAPEAFEALHRLGV
jgi:tetratricopeptide (TPR) repeat protein